VVNYLAKRIGAGRGHVKPLAAHVSAVDQRIGKADDPIIKLFVGKKRRGQDIAFACIANEIGIRAIGPH
jgi:hypothetical protein